MVVGFRATPGVVKARIHRGGEMSMVDDRGCSLGAEILAFVTGVLAGSLVALLLALQSGRESREQL